MKNKVIFNHPVNHQIFQLSFRYSLFLGAVLQFIEICARCLFLAPDFVVGFANNK